MERLKMMGWVSGSLLLTLVTASSLCLAQTSPGALSPGLQAKMQNVQRMMEKRAKSDIPPVRIVLAVKKFEFELKAGKMEQAESSLDLALKRLESAPGEDPLEKKIVRVQKGVKELESKGGEARLIGMVMSKLEPAVLAGDESKAEATIDTALKLLKSKDPRSEPEAAPYVRLLDKISEAQEKAPKWVGAGGDGSKLAPLSERAGQAMKEGKFDEAEKAFDEILVFVRQEPGSRKQEAP